MLTKRNKHYVEQVETLKRKMTDTAKSTAAVIAAREWMHLSDIERHGQSLADVRDGRPPTSPLCLDPRDQVQHPIRAQNCAPHTSFRATRTIQIEQHLELVLADEHTRNALVKHSAAVLPPHLFNCSLAKKPRVLRVKRRGHGERNRFHEDARSVRLLQRGPHDFPDFIDERPHGGVDTPEGDRGSTTSTRAGIGVCGVENYSTVRAIAADGRGCGNPPPRSILQASRRQGVVAVRVSTREGRNRARGAPTAQAWNPIKSQNFARQTSGRLETHLIRGHRGVERDGDVDAEYWCPAASATTMGLSEDVTEWRSRVSGRVTGSLEWVW